MTYINILEYFIQKNAVLGRHKVNVSLFWAKHKHGSWVKHLWEKFRKQERALIDTNRHTQTQTNNDLLAQIPALKEQLEQNKAENTHLKAQVVERSSSSTSVHNQLEVHNEKLFKYIVAYIMNVLKFLVYI